ncbi:hypothetical protein Tco_0634740 [Tanacetum coccineum]
MPSFPSPKSTVSCFNDLEFFKDFENEFPVIVYNDALTSKSDFLSEPTLSPQHIDEFDLKDETSLSECDEEEQNVLYFNDLFPFNIIYPHDLESDKNNDDNEIDIIQSSGDMALPPRDQRHQYLRGLTELMDEGLSGWMLMEHRDSQGHGVFTSRAWRRLFEIRGPLVYELILEFFSTFMFRETVLDLDTAEALQFQLGGAKSARQIPDKGDLSAYWIGISSARDFLGTTPSYTSIRDPILRLCHRVIACNIAGRSQAPEKVLEVVCFGEEARGDDIRGQFVSRLANNFGLITKERLQGLTVIVRDLPAIDIGELVRLQICEELDNTWAWVAPGPEIQPDAVAGALEITEGAPHVDEGGQAVSAPA